MLTLRGLQRCVTNFPSIDRSFGEGPEASVDKFTGDSSVPGGGDDEDSDGFVGCLAVVSFLRHQVCYHILDGSQTQHCSHCRDAGCFWQYL